ncbi:hypothetical protein [Cryobacterium sp. AP23]
MIGSNVGGPAAFLERRMQETFRTGAESFERERGRGPIPKAYLNTSILIVNRSGIMPQIEKWRASERKSRAGRKPEIPVYAVMVLFVLEVQLGDGISYHSIADTLNKRMDAQDFECLGIRDTPGDHDDWYQRAWRSANRLLSLLDPFPAPRNRRLTPEEYADLRARESTETARRNCRRKLERLDWICEQLIHASVRLLPRYIWCKYEGNIAIDATEIEVRGNPNPKDASFRRGNADPHSGRYRREGSHDGQGAKTDDAAYEQETSVMVWNRPGETMDFPNLITAVSFHRPGEISGHALKLVESHQRLGFTRLKLICDRAYNNERPQNFQIPARKLGVELVIDYKHPDLGQQGFYEDLILVDGNWYVKWMPKRLITATRDFRKGLISEDEEQACVASRSAYRMTPKGLPDADGYQRFSYPTPGYMAIDPLTGARVKPVTRSSLTVPTCIPSGKAADMGQQKNEPIKHVQKYPFRSPEWQDQYHMRPLVESSHKLMKDVGAEDLGNPAKRSGRGFAFQYLASTIAAVSSNIRRIFTFFKTDAERTSGGKRYRSRRRKGPDEAPLLRPPEPPSLAPPN